jgi:hypothetical protein
MLMNKIFYFILSFSLLGFGIGILINPRFHDTKHDYYYDFTEVKWPFGMALICIGSIMIGLLIKKRGKDYEDKILICPKCEKVYNRDDIDDKKCLKCNVRLENLEGFYDKKN